jgi:2,3-dihydroxybiphenyl 1,2-dioxygenase
MTGVSQLAYLGFEVRDLSAWEQFGTKILGLGITNRTPEGFGLRLDSYRQRFHITAGDADDLSMIGWELPNEQELAATVARLREAGVDVQEGSAAEAEQRYVSKLFKFLDPCGIPTELVIGVQRGDPFQSEVVRSGFVAEEQGLGHLVISAKSQQENTDFYTKMLGFRLSDHIRCDVYGYKVDIAFFHANTRHHSVAFGDRQRKRLHHFMVEAKSMDEVGLAYDRAIRGGVRIMQTLGRHPNDRMFSFYAKTPSGFQFEFGWGGRHVDDSTWEPTEYQCISEWGHHPPQVPAGIPIK